MRIRLTESLKLYGYVYAVCFSVAFWFGNIIPILISFIVFLFLLLVRYFSTPPELFYLPDENKSVK